MQLRDYERLIDTGGFSSTDAWKRIDGDLRAAIDHVRWPTGGPDFTIYPQSGKKSGEGNGVKPIKLGFVELLKAHGWKPEGRYELADEAPADAVDADKSRALFPGAFDARLELDGDLSFVAEWETGNISSSHRAINKMALAMLEKRLSGGVLVLPTRNLYRFLTDRVGNFSEIAPYFGLWRSLQVERGFLGIISVEHDGESTSVPRIPKGTDGRATG